MVWSQFKRAHANIGNTSLNYKNMNFNYRKISFLFVVKIILTHVKESQGSNLTADMKLKESFL